MSNMSAFFEGQPYVQDAGLTSSTLDCMPRPQRLPVWVRESVRRVRRGHTENTWHGRRDRHQVWERRVLIRNGGSTSSVTNWSMRPYLARASELSRSSACPHDGWCARRATASL